MRSPRLRVPAALGDELALGSNDLVQLLDDVDGHSDRSALVGERPGGGLADPPGCVGRELVAASVVELLCGADETDRPLLNEIEERKALVSVVLGDRDDESKVRLDHVLLGFVVAALDALGELHLLRGREERYPADVLQEDLERIGRDLASIRGGGRRLRLIDHIDLELIEPIVEFVDLRGTER